MWAFNDDVAKGKPPINNELKQALLSRPRKEGGEWESHVALHKEAGKTERQPVSQSGKARALVCEKERERVSAATARRAKVGQGTKKR